MSRRVYRSHIDRAELIVDRLMRAPAKREPVKVDSSRAKITACPPFKDTRFEPAPGYVGEFAAAGIGRYVEADSGPDTEGMGYCDE